MPRLAIIISALGRMDWLEGTLLSVLENRPADCEILVALDQPYADPYDLKNELRFIECGGNSPSRAINQALAATRAPFVHLLASGGHATEHWADEALARFGDRKVASVTPLALDIERPERIFAAGVGYAASGKRYLIGSGQVAATSTSLPGTLAGPAGFAAFYRKAALELVGGFSTQLRLQADVDLSLCLAKAGFCSVLEPNSRVLAHRGVDIDPSRARKALCDERLFWRNLPSKSRLAALMGHALLVAGETLRSMPHARLLTQLASRAWACCELGSHGRHRAVLRHLAQRSGRAKGELAHVRLDHAHTASPRIDAAKARVRG